MTMQEGGQQNTYQAIIISDFISTFVVFTYNDKTLNWFKTCNDAYSVVGYNIDLRAAASLEFPSFQNHRFSGTRNIESIARTFQEKGVQWSNIVYLIGRDRSRTQEMVVNCDSMGQKDKVQFSERGIRVEQGLSCPCSVTQAFRDRRYIHASEYLVEITGDESFSSRNCFVQVFRPLRANRGVHLCCYSIK